MLNLTFSSISCFFTTSNASSNDPVVFHLLLLFPVEIHKIKTNLIFIIVVNALRFGLCDFIQPTVMSLSGQLKNGNITQKACFFILSRALWFGISSHITKHGKQQPRSGSVLFCRPSGRHYSPHVWEIVGGKNRTIFRGCHYSRFYMMISSSFRKTYFYFFRTGNYISSCIKVN